MQICFFSEIVIMKNSNQSKLMKYLEATKITHFFVLKFSFLMSSRDWPGLTFWSESNLDLYQ